MATMAYVVSEVGWEYNDETYYRPESGGGHPKNVFLVKQEAETFCQEKNINELKNIFLNKPLYGSINEYAYDIDELLVNDGEEINKIFKEKIGLSFDDFFNRYDHYSSDGEKYKILQEKEQIRKKIEQLSPQDWEVIEQSLNLTFYEITEAQIMHVLS